MAPRGIDRYLFVMTIARHAGRMMWPTPLGDVALDNCGHPSPTGRIGSSARKIENS